MQCFLNCLCLIIVIYLSVRNYEKSVQVKIFKGGKDRVTKVILHHQQFLVALSIILIFPFLAQNKSNDLTQTLFGSVILQYYNLNNAVSQIEMASLIQGLSLFVYSHISSPLLAQPQGMKVSPTLLLLNILSLFGTRKIILSKKREFKNRLATVNMKEDYEKIFQQIPQGVMIYSKKAVSTEAHHGEKISIKFANEQLY